MSIDIVILGTEKGSKVVPLAEIAQKFGKAEDVKSLERCGTTNLYRFAEGESLESKATEIVRGFLDIPEIQIKPSGLSPPEQNISGIFSSVACTTSDYQMPGLARSVGHNLGLSGIPMINLSMGCAGGMHALQMAYNQLVVDSVNGKRANYVVIAGDHTSRVLDKEAWDTAGIFSDGVAAALVSNYVPGPFSIKKIGSTNLEGDIHSMRIDSKEKIFRMDGGKVFDFATKKVFPAALGLLGLEKLPENVYFIPHQASGAILDGMRRRHKIPTEQFYSDGIKREGNIPAASVYFGLLDAENKELFGYKDVILCGFGAELAVSAVYLKNNLNGGSENE
ncbi:MAG: 3-oxoacyl-[acyl-carrier-protein] synthase III C-terminal domain-containing protein [Nanoarchaeota archaeon]